MLKLKWTWSGRSSAKQMHNLLGAQFELNYRNEKRYLKKVGFMIEGYNTIVGMSYNLDWVDQTRPKLQLYQCNT